MQYGLHLTVCYCYISLQVGFNIQLPQGQCFVRTHMKVQDFFKMLLSALSVASSVAHTHRDTQLCDEALSIQLFQTCSDEPESSMSSYDAALYDKTLQDAVTVLPSYEPFNDPLKDALPPSPPLPNSSMQEAISFERCYGVPQAEAWPIFDQFDPLQWFQQEKAIADAGI